MLSTIILYVSMAVTGVDGNVYVEDFEPLSWEYSNTQEMEKGFEECSMMANAYEKLEAVVEVDCYQN